MPAKTEAKAKAKLKTKIKSKAHDKRTLHSQKKSAAPPTPEPVTAEALSEKNRRAIALLDSWDNPTPEEIAEQKETWAFLKKALDEDRLSPNRPLFPDDDKDQ